MIGSVNERNGTHCSITFTNVPKIFNSFVRRIMASFTGSPSLIHVPSGGVFSLGEYTPNLCTSYSNFSPVRFIALLKHRAELGRRTCTRNLDWYRLKMGNTHPAICITDDFMYSAQSKDGSHYLISKWLQFHWSCNRERVCIGVIQ